MDFYQKLETVEKKIEELENSEEYKTLAKKNRAWAVLKPKEEEKGEWGILKEKLFELKKDKEFYQKAILSTNAAAVKKTDTVRKGYKKETAIKRERQLPKKGNASFGNLLEFVGFSHSGDVSDYIRKRNTEQIEPHPLKDKFTLKHWDYLITLNSRVNPELHMGLPRNNKNELEVVLESDVHDEKVVKEVLAIVAPEEKVDVKNAERLLQVSNSLMSQFPEFQQAFQCFATSKMNAQKNCTLWKREYP
ncbi:hypothetical protein MP638_001254 [Amoeboaphelidium occidentale]|nr:hypothetical protein MP638_001254 [Amoeboaphelidium occidentale]